MINLGKWHMIMRGPLGDEYTIGSGQLPATMIPALDDGNVVITVELAHFIRSLADKIENLCTQGEIPDATVICKATDVHTPELPNPLQ